MWSQGLSRHLPLSFRNHYVDEQNTINDYLEYLIKNHSIVSPKTGIIHVGAHRCQEQSFYKKIKIDNVLWIDANEEFCKDNSQVVNALLADEDGKLVDFIITNNDGLSSSMLELKDHLIEHPDCKELNRSVKKTVKLDTLLLSYPNNYDTLVLDVQGAELLVLKGAVETIQTINCIITEVNTKELYKKCALIEDIDSFLEKQGFVRVYTKMTRHGWGDAIYIRRIICMYVHSGLGNRLFQLAALYSLAKATNSLAVLYDDHIDVCDIHCADKNKYNNFYKNFIRIQGKPQLTLVEIIKENPLNPCIYVNYIPTIYSIKKPIILFDGFFQSLKYFNDYKNAIKALFIKALENSLKDIDTYKIKKDICKNNFIHVRGRDHIHKQNVAHSLPNIDRYYKEALTKYPECTPKNTYIFTDDRRYVLSLDYFKDFTCYDSQDELEDLYMMSQCKNVLITTNSTFSWWGSFLANAEKIVMPIPYLLRGMGYQDIYYDKIVKINATNGDKIFENIISARQYDDKIVILMIKKGETDPWFFDLKENIILVNDEQPLSITHITQEQHNDAYNDMCIIQTNVRPFTSKLRLTMNYCTKNIYVKPVVSSKNYNLVAMTMFKYDVSLIEGWVEHYSKLGVEHFFLYYNDNKPIESLPKFENLTYIQWDYPYLIDRLHYAQLGAMTDMIHQSRAFTKYVLFCDLDEYIIWRPKNTTLKSFILKNNFAVYGFLNNFITLDEPSKNIVKQIENNQYSKTYEMTYGTRSKNIVNVHVIDGIGIHKPFDNSLDDNMCVLASRTCELLHVCNLEGRHHVSLTPQAIAQFLRIANKNSA